MTCICGHHEEAHLSGLGLCAAPEGCNCNHFRKAAPEPTPFVDENKAVQDAMWLLGSEADTAERNLARAYLVMCERLAMVERERDQAIADTELAVANADKWRDAAMFAEVTPAQLAEVKREAMAQEPTR